jgi:hypothetical protein
MWPLSLNRSFYLSPLALAIVFFTPTRNGSFLSHVFLGLAISGAPWGLDIVTGRIRPAPTSVAVLCWPRFDTSMRFRTRFRQSGGAPFDPQRFGVRRSLDGPGLPRCHVGPFCGLAAVARLVLPRRRFISFASSS